MHGEDLAYAIKDPTQSGFAYVESYPRLRVPFCVLDDMEMFRMWPWTPYFITVMSTERVNHVDSKV